MRKFIYKPLIKQIYEIMKRQLNEIEKQTVKKQQILSDGLLRCFISGEIINDSAEIEYDHIHPHSKDGETDPSNIRIVIKKYNRRKSDQSLYNVRDNLRLERLFEEKKNNIKLQDIFGLKEVKQKNIHANNNERNWTPYLKSILFFALQFMTNDERDKLLYRELMDDKQKQIIKQCLHRLFSHPLWNEPEGEIDSLLVSAQKQEDLFNRKGLTEKYVIGRPT